MNQEQEQERLRELAKRVRMQLPEGVFYSLVMWAPGEPQTCVYFSNAHRAESIIAFETLLGERPPARTGIIEQAQTS
jgi:hypothetical protein